MVIGLTGGIGSGKSIVAALFELLGFAVFHSDDVARNIYFDPIIKNRIISLLGAETYISDKQLNKTYISNRIFNDAILLQKLNEIIHPAVGEKFEEFKLLNKAKPIIKETALLFEAKLQHQVNKIIVVAADDEFRIQRTIKRDRLSRTDVLKKIESQFLQEEKIRQADWVIYNNEKDFLITQVLKICSEINS